MWPFPSNTEAKAAPAATERATLASPDDELVALLTGGYGVGTAAGEPVGPQSALRVPAVLAAVRVIANTVASLDVRVMRLEVDGTAIEDFQHPANRILARPTPWMGRFTYLQTLAFDALKHGVGFAVANRIRGEVREMIRVRPGQLVCDLNLDTGEPSYRLGTRSYPFTDVAHIQPIPSDNGELTSIVQLAREGIGFAATLQKHGSRLFANSAKPGGILSVKPAAGSNVVAPRTLKNIAEVWRQTFGSNSDSGKTAALPGDVTYQSLALNSVDAQYLDLWKLAVLEIARAFGVPPQFLQDLERTTHSNAEELGLQFVAFCIKPFCDLVTEAHERVLFTEEERFTHFIEFDYSDLVRPNTLALFDAMVKGVGGGVLTPNNARRRIGEQPTEGGDVLLVPLNTRPVNQPQAAPAEPSAVPAPAEPPTPEAIP